MVKGGSELARVIRLCVVLIACRLAWTFSSDVLDDLSVPRLEYLVYCVLNIHFDWNIEMFFGTLFFRSSSRAAVGEKGGDRIEILPLAVSRIRAEP